MHNPGRRACSILLLCCLAAGLWGGCGGGPRPASSTPESLPASLALEDTPPTALLCTMAQMDDALSTAVARGVQDAADRAGFATTAHNSFGNSADQVAAIEQFAEAGGGVLVCQPVEYAPLTHLLERLDNIGTTILTFGPQAAGRDAGILMPDHELGAHFAYYTAVPWAEEGFGGQARIAILEYPATVASPVGLAAGMAERLALSLPNSTVTRYALNTTAEAVVRRMLEDGPVDIVLGVDDALALAAMAVWVPPQLTEGDLADASASLATGSATGEERYLPAGRVPLFAGIGASTPALEALEDADSLFAATLDLQGEAVGAAMVALAARRHAGEDAHGEWLRPIVVDKRGGDGI